MNNHVVVHLEFDFKGKRFSPSMRLDLDESTFDGSDLNSLYAQLARKNDIDLYSYEYEMMQCEVLIFSHASGMAEAYLSAEGFDFSGYQKARNEQVVMRELLSVAQENMGVESLSNVSGLEKTLLAAFNIGRQSK